MDENLPISANLWHKVSYDGLSQINGSSFFLGGGGIKFFYSFISLMFFSFHYIYCRGTIIIRRKEKGVYQLSPVFHL